MNPGSTTIVNHGMMTFMVRMLCLSLLATTVHAQDAPPYQRLNPRR